MTEQAKTTIRPNVESYVRGRAASGSRTLHNGDPVARALEGATLDEVYELAALVTDQPEADLREKYGHLNVGQQRMNAGNRIRGAINKMEKAEAGSGHKFLEHVSSGIRQNIDARMVKAEEDRKAKEAKAAEAKAEKPAKAKRKKKEAEAKAA